MNIKQIFPAKVAPANVSGCELWTAGGGSDGYGRLWDGERRVGAHRYSWELANGPIPAGMCVCHKCDTPACVNPAHLFLGTRADNMADMTTKGRGRRPNNHGSKNGGAKLTESEAVEVFLAIGRQRAIAARYGICPGQVSKIKHRKKWAQATAAHS